MTPLQALERIIKNVQAYTNIDIEQELDTIAEALHVPTADEVSDALSDYLGETVVYSSGSFYNARETAEACAIGNLGLVYFSTHLPPRLITLIGRFYEAQE